MYGPPVYSGNLGTGQIEFDAGAAGSWGFAANTFSNPSGRAMTYSLSGSYPATLTFDASTRTLSGTPAKLKVTQTFTLTLSATDPVDGLSASVTLTLTINGFAGTDVVSGGSLAQTQSVQTETATTPNIVAEWFTYDADNRMTVENGTLENAGQANAQIVITDALNSAANVYDLAGDQTAYTTVNASGQTLSQQNTYDARGELTMVQTQTTPGGTYAPFETRSYDADGHLISDITYNTPGHTGSGTYNGNAVTFNDGGWVASDTIYTYDISGQLTDQSTYAEDTAQDLITQYGTGVDASAYATQDGAPPATLPTVGGNTDGALYLANEQSYAASSGYGYDADGNVLGYHVITTANLQQTARTDSYQNTYLLQNSALNAKTTASTTSGTFQPSTNTNTYNALGELVETNGTTNGTATTEAMAYTADGKILQTNNGSAGGITLFMYAEGQSLGSVSTGGAINVLSSTSGFSNSDLGSQNYVVQQGDTLQSVAQAVYGDSNYDYILAEANGLSLNSPLAMGTTLRLPQVTTSGNNATTFMPYKQGNIVNPGASACVTTAQLVTNAIATMLNQQSLAKQMIEKIEAEQAQEKAQKEEKIATARMDRMERPMSAAQMVGSYGTTSGAPNTGDSGDDGDDGDFADFGDFSTPDDFSDFDYLGDGGDGSFDFATAGQGVGGDDTSDGAVGDNSDGSDGTFQQIVAGFAPPAPNQVIAYNSDGTSTTYTFDPNNLSAASTPTSVVQGTWSNTGVQTFGVQDDGGGNSAGGGGFVDVGGQGSTSSYDPNNALTQYNGAGYANYLAGGYAASNSSEGQASSTAYSGMPLAGHSGTYVDYFAAPEGYMGGAVDGQATTGGMPGQVQSEGGGSGASSADTGQASWLNQPMWNDGPWAADATEPAWENTAWGSTPTTTFNGDGSSLSDPNNMASTGAINLTAVNALPPDPFMQAMYEAQGDNFFGDASADTNDDTSTGQYVSPSEWRASDYAPPSSDTTTIDLGVVPAGTGGTVTYFPGPNEALPPPNESSPSAFDPQDYVKVSALNAQAEQASQQFLANFHTWQQADAKQFVMFNVDIAITGGSFGLASSFGLTKIALSTASAGGVGGYLSDGWNSVPNGIAFGALAGIGLAFASTGIAAASVAGEWGVGTTATAQITNVVVGDGLTAGAATLFNNYMDGKPLMSDVWMSAAIGATAPIASGEVILAAAGETGAAAVVFNGYTGVLNSIGVGIDAHSRQGSSQGEK